MGGEGHADWGKPPLTLPKGRECHADWGKPTPILPKGREKA